MQVEEYFGSGTWLRVDGSSWLEELKEQLTVREYNSPLYMHQEHIPAMEAVRCILQLLKGKLREEEG